MLNEGCWGGVWGVGGCVLTYKRKQTSEPICLASPQMKLNQSRILDEDWPKPFQPPSHTFFTTSPRSLERLDYSPLLPMNLCLFGHHSCRVYKRTATPRPCLDCHVLGAGINHEWLSFAWGQPWIWSPPLQVLQKTVLTPLSTHLLLPLNYTVWLHFFSEWWTLKFQEHTSAQPHYTCSRCWRLTVMHFACATLEKLIVFGFCVKWNIHQ